MQVMYALANHSIHPFGISKLVLTICCGNNSMNLSVEAIVFIDIDPAVQKVVGSTRALTSNFNRHLILDIQRRFSSW